MRICVEGSIIHPVRVRLLCINSGNWVFDRIDMMVFADAYKTGVVRLLREGI